MAEINEFNLDKNEAYKWLEAERFVDALCASTSADTGFHDEFLRRLHECSELFEEFVYFIENQDFLCKMNVSGITVTDILVWQIDKFKAGIDEGKFALKYDADTMILMAFNTMYEVKQSPEKYLENFRTVTGTDYEGKFK